MEFKDRLRGHVVSMINSDMEYIKSLIKKGITCQKITKNKMDDNAVNMLVKILWRQFLEDCRTLSIDKAINNISKGLK